MRIKTVTVRNIIDFLDTSLITVYGSIDKYINNMANAERINKDSLDWINPKKDNKQCIAEASPARVILVDPSVAYSERIKEQGKTLLVVDNPKMALARIGNEFFADQPQVGIHPTSIVDIEAKIPGNVTIGPFCYIGKAKIGEGTVIGSNVRIYDDVVIGTHCVIKDGAIIGGEGFGFERDESGNRFRFPQIGDVILGDYVEVGANTCIDRGALSTTTIGDYTKINNLCHIAHNNIIGKNVVIAAEVNLSGGNTIEDDCWIAPASSLKGYIHVGKGSTIGMGAVVVKDIPAGEVWVGNPARKLR